jgi:hypothetical protein
MTEDEINWLHSLFQELESQEVQLPMGDYLYVYRILENAREAIENDGWFDIGEIRI